MKNKFKVGEEVFVANVMENCIFQGRVVKIHCQDASDWVYELESPDSDKNVLSCHETMFTTMKEAREFMAEYGFTKERGE